LFVNFIASKSHATNLLNSFLDHQDILFINEANLVLDAVLNRYFQAKAHNITFQIFHSIVSLSNGHTLYHAAQPIADLLNTDSISLAASAESFLEIQSCNHLAI
jgi:hypothetical protein